MSLNNEIARRATTNDMKLEMNLYPINMKESQLE